MQFLMDLNLNEPIINVKLMNLKKKEYFFVNMEFSNVLLIGFFPFPLSFMMK